MSIGLRGSMSSANPVLCPNYDVFLSEQINDLVVCCGEVYYSLKANIELFDLKDAISIVIIGHHKFKWSYLFSLPVIPVGGLLDPAFEPDGIEDV